jgi:O-antigen/teichoic acid export membrane protein
MSSSLIKNNLLYVIGSAAQSLAVFLLVPYLINSLSSDEYGAWAIYEIAIVFLNMFLIAGMDTSLMRQYWYLEGEEERKRLVGTVLTAVLGWSLFLFTILGLSAGQIMSQLESKFSVSYSTFEALLLVLAISSLEAIFFLLLNLFRIREQADKFVSLSIGRMILFLFASIAGVQIFGGVTGALLGRLAASIIGLLLAVILTRSYIRLHFSFSEAKKLLSYGLPLLPTSIASYILLASDRYILGSVSTLEAVAVYSFAYKVAQVLDIMVTRPFSIDWAPRRFKILTLPYPKKKYASALVLYIFSAAFMGLAIIAVMRPIYYLVAPQEYFPGMTVIPIILAANIIYGLSYPLNVGIMIKDKTKYLPIIGWVSAFFCLLLNFWLIPRFGFVGAAWATLFSYIVWTGGITLASMIIYPISYPIRSLLLVVSSTVLVYAVYSFLDITFPGINVYFLSLIKAASLLIIFSVLGYSLWYKSVMKIFAKIRTLPFV